MKEHLVTINGKTKSITRWAAEYNLPPDCIRVRIRKGWPAEKLLSEARPKWNGELWLVLNVEFAKLKNKSRREEIENFVIKSLAAERKKVNKKKYQEVRLMIESQEMNNESRIVKEISKLLDTKILNIESKIDKLQRQLSDLDEKIQGKAQLTNGVKYHEIARPCLVCG